MKKRSNVAAVFILFFAHMCHGMASPRLTSAVTHGAPIGRVGDYLLWYIKAKYVAKQYNLPFLLNPPTDHLAKLGLSQLQLCRQERLLSDHLYLVGEFKKISSVEDIIKSNASCFFVAPDFAYASWNSAYESDDIASWDAVLADTAFRNELRCLIALPDEQLMRELFPPKNCISVAMHIRTGNRWDTEENKRRWFYKFPDLNFYKECLQKLVELFEHKPLFVHLFTDDPDTGQLIHELLNSVSGTIKYRWRNQGNSPLRFIMQDLMAMKEYDCLIRGMSGFAQVAQLIGNYKVVLYPKKFDGNAVTEIGMTLP